MKEQNNIFYVYAHYRASGRKKNEIFYVGKGYGNRAYVKSDRNKYWKHIVNKYDYYVEILYDGLDEQVALGLEISTIARYGRKDLGLGPLVNMTDGGDGVVGSLVQYQVSVRNQFGDIFPSLEDAVKWCGLASSSNICSCIYGNRKSAGVHPENLTPLQWKKAEDLTPFEKYSRTVFVPYLPVKNQFGDVFDSPLLAANWCGLYSGSHIVQCCRNRPDFPSAGRHPLTGEKLQWKYLEDTTPFIPLLSVIKNQFGDTFQTTGEAARWCGLKDGGGGILKCCKLKSKSAGKHPETKQKLQWRFIDDETPFLSDKDLDTWSGTSVINQFGDIFVSATEAAKWCGLSGGSKITACCKGRQPSAGKHPLTGDKLIWRYI